MTNLNVATRRLPVLRDLAVQLVIRDLKLRYRRTIVGLAWSFAFPVGQVIVLSFIFTLVLPTKVGKYSAFVSIGVLVWTWFQSSLVMASTAITGNRELVRRPGFPSSVLPVSVVGTNLILFLMAFPAMVLVVLYDGGRPGLSVSALPLVIAVQFLLTLGISYLVASLNVKFRDTQQMVTLLQPFMGNPTLLMIAIMLLVMAVGTAMDMTPTILILTPVLMPVVKAAGIDPVYFGVLFIINNAIGLITPPVGTVLNTVAGVGGMKMDDVTRGMLPFMWAEFAMMFLMVLFPQLVTVPARWFAG